MYTSEDRERLRSELISAARAEPRITGAALFGSAATSSEDRWSDIDLAFGVSNASEIPMLLTDWTERIYERHGALHHVDVLSGAWVYRVFLLGSTLQLDLAFAPAADFGARAPTFRLLVGDAVELSQAAPPAAQRLIGLAWLHALHARSSIARGHRWQAEYMISAVRDQALALGCVRHRLPADYGRGLHRLPPEVTRPFDAALVRSLDNGELARAFGAAVRCLLGEIRHVDPGLAQRLEGALLELAQSEA